LIESKIRELESGLSNAEIIGPGSKRTKHVKVVVGSKVSLKDTSSGRQVSYTLVDVREADVAAGRISTASPVGQALLNRTVGDTITINVPKGTLHYTVQKIGT